MARFTTLWRNTHLPNAITIKDLIKVLNNAKNKLEQMAEAGVQFTSLNDDYYILSTDDPQIANRFGMICEDEICQPEYGGESGIA